MGQRISFVNLLYQALYLYRDKLNHSVLTNFSILGHEGIIEVIDHMRRDAVLNQGDRLTFHVVDCCNKCENCKDGLQQKCASLFKVVLPLNFIHRRNLLNC